MIEEQTAWKILEVQCDKSDIDFKDRLIEHCKIVRDLSSYLAKIMIQHGVKINTDLTIIGAILHDIGRTSMKKGDHPVKHGIYGEEIVKTLKFDGYEQIARFCTNHIGIGIKKEQASQIGLPERDYIPELIEEKIVTYCDNLVEYDRNKKIYMINDKNYIIERMEKDISEEHSKETKEFMEKLELLAGQGFKEFEKYRKEYDHRLMIQRSS